MQPGWYDLNLGRSYPFIAESIDQEGAGHPRNLPRETLVDCGIMLGPMSGHILGQHVVWLDSVEHAGTQLIFKFQTNGPILKDYDFEFGVPLAEAVGTRYLTVWNEGEQIQEEISASGGLCVETSDWSGFLVVGDLNPLLSKMNPGDRWQSDDNSVQLEPSCVQSLYGQYVTQIHVANLPRTRNPGHESCRTPCYTYPTEWSVLVQATCIGGPIWFSPGGQCQILQEDDPPKLIFHAVKGANLGGFDTNPCYEVALLDTETVPETYVTLDAAPTCSQVVKELGGVSGPLVRLIPGPGVQIREEPHKHRILIDVNFHDIKVGLHTDIVQRESTNCGDIPRIDPNPCHCGPA